MLRDQEANILQLGEKLREEGKTQEMTHLIQKVRVILKYMSKAKAAKLVRGLVDMFLEMKTNRDPGDSGENEVRLCKASLALITFCLWKQIRFNHERRRQSIRL